MDVTLKQLRAFIHVVQTGQFTAAGHRMHITQSALSTLIKDLETTLGMQLINRSTRHMELTRTGRHFYQEISKTLNQLDHTVQGVKDMAQLRSGSVSVVASTVISSGLVSPVFRDFKNSHPGVQLSLQDVAEEDIMNTVLSGAVDFGIGTANDVLYGLQAEPLFDDHFIALLPSQHPLAGQKQLAWADLQPYPFIALASRSPIRKLIDAHLHKHGIALKIVNEVSFATTVLSLVSANLGISVLPMNNHPYLPAFQLEARPLREPLLTRQISLFTQKGRNLSPAAVQLASLLHEYAAQHPAQRT